MVGHFGFTAYYIGKRGLFVQNTKGIRYELIPGLNIKEISQWL